jgi:hypothetical protein
MVAITTATSDSLQAWHSTAGKLDDSSYGLLVRFDHLQTDRKIVLPSWQVVYEVY